MTSMTARKYSDVYEGGVYQAAPRRNVTKDPLRRLTRWDDLDAHLYAVAEILRADAETIGRPAIASNFGQIRFAGEPQDRPFIAAIYAVGGRSDPINRWNKAPVARRDQNGNTIEIDRPPTFPPKSVKQPRALITEHVMPGGQTIATLSSDKATIARKRWEAAREAVPTLRVWQQVVAMLLDRKAITEAAKAARFPDTKRGRAAMRDAVIDALLAANRVQHG